MGASGDHDSRLARMARHGSRLAGYFWRFVSDARFRSKTIHFIQSQTTTDGVTATRSRSERPAPPWMEGYRLYLVGGCELTYLKEWFAERGAVVYHTFDHHRSSDPYSETADASPLWTFRPDAVVLSPVQGTARLFDQVRSKGRALSPEDQRQGLETTAAAVRAAATKVQQRLGVPVVVMSQLFIHRTPLGVLEQSILGNTWSLSEMKRRYDLEIYEVARACPSTYVLDVESALAREGLDATMWASSDVQGTHVTRRGGELLAERLERMLWALDPRSRRIKCAVFDLDDTLWSGILREDGVDGVFVRHDHLAAMRNLSSRGILLAICSKNDPVEAELVAQLLGAELHEKIVSMSLDWEPKSARLAKLAADLGIGLDTLAFFDDNPRERAEVEMNSPAVLVLADSDIMAALEMAEFEPGPGITSEADARSTMYRQQAQRSEVEAISSSPEVFLASLELRLDLHAATGDELTRVAELIARTNQLNATMQRTSLAQLRAAVDSGGSIVVACLSDRFGDYGLVAAAVSEVVGGSLRLIELAVSCRAMGRSVEHALVAELVGQVEPGRNLVLDFVSTERNGELRRILGEIGFVPQGSREGVETLGLEGGAVVAVPDWLVRTSRDGAVPER